MSAADASVPEKPMLDGEMSAAVVPVTAVTPSTWSKATEVPSVSRKPIQYHVFVDRAADEPREVLPSNTSSVPSELILRLAPVLSVHMSTRANGGRVAMRKPKCRNPLAAAPLIWAKPDAPDAGLQRRLAAPLRKLVVLKLVVPEKRRPELAPPSLSSAAA